MTSMHFGIISELDPSKGLVRVKLTGEDDGDGNDFVTPFIPFLVRASGSDKETFPVDVDSHVVVLMDEHWEDGAVLGMIYSKDNAPDGAGENIFRLKFKDGSSVQFDRESGAYNADFKGSATIKAPSITIDGDVTITGEIIANKGISVQDFANFGSGMKIAGTMTADGDVKAGLLEISLLTHKHNVTAVGSPTGPSTP